MKTTVAGMLAGAVLLAAPAAGQEVKFGGQVRHRFEYRDPVAGGSWDSFTSMRVRANLTAFLSRQVSAFVQVQDVRIWGEESNTLTDFTADGLDLHQGYIDFRGMEKESVTLVRIGRQAVAFGEERLIGAVEWTQQGRSFDGVLARLGSKRSRVNLMAMRLADPSATNQRQGGTFAGAYAEFEGIGSAVLDLYGLYNNASNRPTTDQVSFGASLHRDRGNFPYRFEATYQTGERGARDVAAFMLAGRVGATFANGKGSFTLWYDYLSGDDQPADAKVKVFDTLFGTNHKFYGFADLFTNIPAHTGNLGLQDAALKGSYRVRDGLSFDADLHAFRTAKQGQLTSARLGEELDLTGTYRYTAGVTFIGGVSWVVDGPGLRELGRLTKDMAWTYLMLNVTF